ncbi:MAG: maleylpyruvate isomerase family mycothiol-dependent enzyme [Acidobacteriota bacterium]|nr:maleylpyruvate isomerase family mycothiol-dependent enzyme [Acidobacteriota bacterium]
MGESFEEPVVGLLAEEWEAICGLGGQLTDEEWDLPSECPGWTVRDVLSHMVGTERSLLGDPQPPAAPEAPHVRNPVGTMNEAWVAERRGRPGSEVLAEFEAVTRRRIEELAGFGRERFEQVGPSPVGQVPYREFMAVRVMDCWVHEQDMRVATGRPGHSEGPVADLALGRIASAMGFVVGKKAAAPEGTTVRFSLSGPSARELGVAVRDGRGRAEELSEPTLTLEMDTEVFWRLGCGRVSGEAALDAGLVGMGGDEDLGRRILRNMAFMI